MVKIAHSGNTHTALAVWRNREAQERKKIEN